jgi:hypothetical protein
LRLGALPNAKVTRRPTRSSPPPSDRGNGSPLRRVVVEGTRNRGGRRRSKPTSNTLRRKICHRWVSTLPAGSLRHPSTRRLPPLTRLIVPRRFDWTTGRADGRPLAPDYPSPVAVRRAPPSEDRERGDALRGSFVAHDRYDDACGQAPRVTFTSERFPSR